MPKGKPLSEVPAGDARREQARVNVDELAMEAAARNEQVEGGRIDPAAFQPDREILQHLVGDFNELEVSNADPNYVYAWVCTRANGVMVGQKQTARVRDPETGHAIPCWEVVSGAMPEAIENKTAVGTRVIGDTLLMRCRRDRHLLLVRHEKAKREARYGSVESNLLTLEDQARKKGLGVTVHTDHVLADPRLRQAAMAAARSGMAKQEFTRRVKEGTVEGAHIEDPKTLERLAAAQGQASRLGREATPTGRE